MGMIDIIGGEERIELDGGSSYSLKIAGREVLRYDADSCVLKVDLPQEGLEAIARTHGLPSVKGVNMSLGGREHLTYILNGVKDIQPLNKNKDSTKAEYRSFNESEC